MIIVCAAALMEFAVAVAFVAGKVLLVAFLFLDAKNMFIVRGGVWGPVIVRVCLFWA